MCRSARWDCRRPIRHRVLWGVFAWTMWLFCNAIRQGTAQRYPIELTVSWLNYCAHVLRPKPENFCEALRFTVLSFAGSIGKPVMPILRLHWAEAWCPGASRSARTHPPSAAVGALVRQVGRDVDMSSRPTLPHRHLLTDSYRSPSHKAVIIIRFRSPC